MPTELTAFSWLLGSWVGVGTGQYPTIEDFTYTETVTFGHVGKPFLAYQQRTMSPAGLPMHAEMGYLRPVGADTAELVIAQPTGIAEIHTGSMLTAADGSVEFRFASATIASTPTAKRVDEVRRTIRWHGDVLSYELDMSAVGEPLQFHLSARLQRSS